MAEIVKARIVLTRTQWQRLVEECGGEEAARRVASDAAAFLRHMQRHSWPGMRG